MDRDLLSHNRAPGRTDAIGSDMSLVRISPGGAHLIAADIAGPVLL